MSCNCVFLLGPTAVGKTAIGVRLADRFSGEIISVDSRQVYRGLDIGTGKDLAEYEVNGKKIPHHLIDVCDLSTEFSLLDFQKGFYGAFSKITEVGKLPICVGGTGMYADSILRNYPMVELPDGYGAEFHLEEKSYGELKSILVSEKQKLHNTSEFGSRERLIKAILINRFSKTAEYGMLKERMLESLPEVRPLVLCTTLDRALVRERIARRLRARIDGGLVEEVERLVREGNSFERLESLGLEYRFVSEYLRGAYGEVGTEIAGETLFNLLCTAICQFAKRQETWFRGMERKGVNIHWLPHADSVEERLEAAEKCVEGAVSMPQLERNR